MKISENNMNQELKNLEKHEFIKSCCYGIKSNYCNLCGFCYSHDIHNMNENNINSNKIER